ncbi:MAG: hypothetical protein C0505_00685 [Leptothrix sp. (in: Bacteria)]|nr:hypothetical protein [Leptothrix sp. (in: b-proteobacteria)]
MPPTGPTMTRTALPLALLAAVTCAAAEPLPSDAQERSCWLRHTRERTQLRLNEPIAVEVANLRDGDVVRSPFRVDFAVRGMGVIPAGQVHPKAGHHHVLINTSLPMNPREKIPFNDFHRHFGKAQTGAVLALPAGVHRMRLLFADHDHRPYFVFSPELRIQVAGPRSETPLRIDAANFAATCSSWYQDERSRPRPDGRRAVITNLRDHEPVVSPFNLRLAVDGFGVAPKGRGGAGLGHFLLDVLGEGGRVVQAIDLGHGATQVGLFLNPGPYTLRLRFVDDGGQRDLVPPDLTPILVTAQVRL